MQLHKSFASDKKGNKLEECLCKEKSLYNNKLDIKNNPLKDLKIIYTNILENRKPEIYINNKVFNGTLVYDNCILTYKDLGGTMLSKLNDILVEKVTCSHCGHYHTDNGVFAYTPHRKHMCLYCGHMFLEKEKNIGNECCMLFNVPKLVQKNEKIEILDRCCIEYDILNGKLTVNGKNVNRVIVNEKEISLSEFLNNTLKNEF